MTIFALLLVVIATCAIVWLCQQGTIPAPFNWIAYAVLIIIWFWILLMAAGLGGSFLNQPIT